MKNLIISAVCGGVMLMSALTPQTPVQDTGSVKELGSYTVTQVTYQKGMELGPSVHNDKMVYFQTSLDRMIDMFPLDDFWFGATPSNYDIVLRDLSKGNEQLIEKKLVIRDFPYNRLTDAAKLLQSGSIDLDKILDYAPSVVEWSPDGSRIAYNVNEDIVVRDMRLGFKSKTADFNSGRIHEMEWSNDGRRLLYVHDDKLYLTDIFTKQTTELGRASRPKFVSDTRIVCSVNSDKTDYIAFFDTKGTKEVTSLKGTNPSPSPDGKYIAYLTQTSDIAYELHLADISLKNDKTIYLNVMEQELKWSDENVLSAVVYRLNESGKIAPAIVFYDITGENLGEIGFEDNTGIANMEWADESTLYFDKIKFNPNIKDPLAVISDPESVASSGIYRLDIEWLKREKQSGLPNPASQFCVEKGYKLEIRTNHDGSQTGYCIFPDRSECEEWAYYRGECQKNKN